MTPTPDLVDLDAYFQRIGANSDPHCAAALRDRTPTLKTLQAIHLCHPKTIAFENLNPLLKLPVSLDIVSLQQKLIHEGRGGYCFEQNSLLRSVLVALGFQVTSLAARVVWNAPAGTITSRSHMLLRVEIDGTPYIADVGFGGLTLTAPLVLVPDLEQRTPHEPFRFILTEGIYTMQARIREEWVSLYRFDLQEQYPPDYEVSNWYVSTHPRSLFVNSLIAARADSTCRYALRNNQLTVHHLDGQTEKRGLTSGSELRAVLEEVFQLRLQAIADLDGALQRWVEGSDSTL